MLFAILASRSERLPAEHLGVMNLEAASLWDGAARRGKRGEDDPQISSLRGADGCDSSYLAKAAGF